MNKSTGIFSDFLRELGVPHTVAYSERQFSAMPFASMFGLNKLLESYGVESSGVQLSDKHDMVSLPVPFIVKVGDAYAIVTSIDSTKATYPTQGIHETVPSEELIAAAGDRVFIARPGHHACEPEYRSHRFAELTNKLKPWLLAMCLLSLFLWSFFAQGLFTYISLWLIAALDICGIYISCLLVQKSAHIDSRHADAVCAVVQAGGCDDILNTSAAKFFGIFGWSEVGFAYFSISLLCLLIYPECIGSLALCNLLCLPFSFWSVWYQKFKAHTWCTLCLCVQSLLWLLFFCYLGGGWVKDAFPVNIDFIAVGLCYLSALLALNAVMPLIERPKKT